MRHIDHARLLVEFARLRAAETRAEAKRIREFVEAQRQTSRAMTAFDFEGRQSFQSLHQSRELLQRISLNVSIENASTGAAGE